MRGNYRQLPYQCQAAHQHKQIKPLSICLQPHLSTSSTPAEPPSSPSSITPLLLSVRYGRINTCHRLLETITDSRLVNEGDEAGLTPLHLASKEGHTKVVELLLRKGALFHR